MLCELSIVKHLPDKNRVESDFTNTRASKNHFPKIVHQIASWEDINSREVVLTAQ